MRYKIPKLCVIGHGRHGKDTFAEILNEHFGMEYASSSQAAADIFIYDELKVKYNYKTPEECYTDRSNHRTEWYNLICGYNETNKAALASEILKTSDCYVGMRDDREIEECINQNLFDLIIWVDASERLPLESPDSMKITKESADIIINNNSTLEDFTKRVLRFGEIYKKACQ